MVYFQIFLVSLSFSLLVGSGFYGFGNDFYAAYYKSNIAWGGFTDQLGWVLSTLTIYKTQKRKLSRAAIETLSIIAYQQPITRSEIENIRGVQMGRGSIDHLMEIGWIKPSGRKNIPGKPALWVTTELFMEHFGIENMSDLPSKNELKASGFLEKRSAIATITDIANKNEQMEELEIEEKETLEDFISEENPS